MTPERWERIDQLFHAALSHGSAERVAFLTRECAGDEHLREEVESLLASHEQSDSFIETPASDLAASLLAHGGYCLEGGQMFGHFRVTRLLASGGMGDVYLADDTKLGRPVALKLLPSHLVGDGARVHRFRQEAAAVLKLNHPNIVTVHDFDSADGRHFIASEFIEGETLRERLARGPLAPAEALDVAAQVAAALAAAHAEGIVHRDIKPENVMLRPDGFVKVLDFGLAKLAEEHTARGEPVVPAGSPDTTNPGVVMGTTPYMSPEQARGLPVDARTDVWSLGVVLYEMIAGRPPFSGETASDIIVSILDREPPPLNSPSEGMPADLEHVISQALRKNLNERYQSAQELISDLKNLRWKLDDSAVTLGKVSGQATLSGTARDTQRVGAVYPYLRAKSLITAIRRHKLSSTVALTVSLMATAFGLSGYKYISQRIDAAPFLITKTTKLTATGDAVSAAVSPDGKHIVYSIDEAGKQGLWIKEVGSPNGGRIVSPDEVDYRGLTYSRDGAYIYYVVSDKNSKKGALYQVPAAGGPVGRMKEGVDSPPGLSPDGKQFAFIRANAEQGVESLMLASLDWTMEWEVAVRRYPEHFSLSSAPAWSPDGSSITCVVESADSTGFFMTVTKVQITDGTDRLLSAKRWASIGQTAWLPDGSALVLAAQDFNSSFHQLWRLTYPDGQVHQITSDLNDYKGVSLPTNSGAVLTVQKQVFTSIWASAEGNFDHLAKITSGAGLYYDLSWTPEGKILYASEAGGNSDIWEMGADGSGQRQLTTGAGRNFAPVASPDGRYVVFHSNRSGTWQIWRMDRDGGDPTQLSTGAEGSNWPQVSPDGRWVIYEHVGSGLLTSLWRVSIDGAMPTRLTVDLCTRPSISPDGRLIAYWHKERAPNAPWRIAVIPFEGGPPVRLFDVPQSEANGLSVMHWTPNGQNIIYTDFQNERTNLRLQPLQGSQPKQLTNFINDQFYSFDLSRDGKLILSRSMRTDDVVLISYDSR